MKLIRIIPTVLLFAVCAFAQNSASAAGTKAAAPATPQLKIKVGDMAPDLTLPDQNGKAVTLSSFRGKKSVVLAFYIFAFSGG